VPEPDVGGRLDHALYYLGLGLPIFPVCQIVPHTHWNRETRRNEACTKLGKRPLVNWKNYQAAPPSEADIRGWWKKWRDANIGMATGHLSRIVVIDLDGDTAKAQAIARGGYANGPHSFTGRIGGEHRFFAYSDGAPRDFTKKYGIDFRGEGGYVILPPSEHVSGRQYVWGEELDNLGDLPPLPDWIYEVANEGADGTARGSHADAEGYFTQPGRNTALTALAGSMRRQGASEETILTSLRIINEAQCRPPLNDDELQAVAHSVARYVPEPALRNGRATEPEWQTPPDAFLGWPAPLDQDAFYGPLGEFVNAAADQSEADPAGILAMALSGASAALDPRTGAWAGDAWHPIRINAVLIGPTAHGRKGSASKITEAAVRLVDPVMSGKIVEGLSSGGGMVYPIRDEVLAWDKKQEADVVVDPGVMDKRLLVVESEFASTLRVLEREGNTLSAIIRRAWDLPPDGVLGMLTKNSPTRATGAHVVICGHVTHDELLRYLNRTELVNGFANRFLWFASKRVRELPFGARVNPEIVSAFADAVLEAARWTRSTHAMDWAPETRDLWRDAYHKLGADRGGLYGAVTARGEPQVLRVSEFYAALDRVELIQPAHLKAAMAVWDYVDRSCRWVFGQVLGDEVADEILLLLRSEGRQTRTQLYDALGRNTRKPRIVRALGMLEANGLAHRGRLPSAGKKPLEVWEAS
jgi:hypothetical protein